MKNSQLQADSKHFIRKNGPIKTPSIQPELNLELRYNVNKVLEEIDMSEQKGDTHMT